MAESVDNSMLNNENATDSYYPWVTPEVADNVLRQWQDEPERARRTAQALLTEHSLTLSALRHIFRSLAQGATYLPEGIDLAIDDGMLFAYALLATQAKKEGKILPDIQKNPFDISDEYAKEWRLITDLKDPSDLDASDIILPLFMRNPSVGETVMEDVKSRPFNKNYFIAGAALVTQLYYEAAFPHVVSH